MTRSEVAKKAWETRRAKAGQQVTQQVQDAPKRKAKRRRDPVKDGMVEWRREVVRLRKQARCTHKRVLWDATGNVGICWDCGITIKRSVWEELRKREAQATEQEKKEESNIMVSQAAKKAWDTRKKRMTDENAYYEAEYEDSVREERSNLYRVIMDLGGIDDKLYSVPLVLRRTGGLPLDELATELRHFGYPCKDAGDLYNLIAAYWWWR